MTRHQFERFMGIWRGGPHTAVFITAEGRTPKCFWTYEWEWHTLVLEPREGGPTRIYMDLDAVLAIEVYDEAV
jgi:hypothetical protein